MKYTDPETGQTYVFLTNNLEVQAITIAQLYKQRWQVELFFKWIKGNLRVEILFGHSENAVKTQIWIAVCVYLILAIVKKRFNLPESLSQLLHFFSDVLYEQAPIQTLFQQFNYKSQHLDSAKQLSLEGL